MMVLGYYLNCYTFLWRYLLLIILIYEKKCYKEYIVNGWVEWGKDGKERKKRCEKGKDREKA